MTNYCKNCHPRFTVISEELDCPVCKQMLHPIPEAFPRLMAFIRKCFDLEGPGWSLMRRSPR